MFGDFRTYAIKMEGVRIFNILLIHSMKILQLNMRSVEGQQQIVDKLSQNFLNNSIYVRTTCSFKKTDKNAI